MFIADVVAVDVDEAYMDEKDTFHLSEAKPLAYSHGRYYGMGKEFGSFGYSVRKQEKKHSGKKSGQAETADKKKQNADAGRKVRPHAGSGAGNPRRNRKRRKSEA